MLRGILNSFLVYMLITYSGRQQIKVMYK